MCEGSAGEQVRNVDEEEAVFAAAAQTKLNFGLLEWVTAVAVREREQAVTALRLRLTRRQRKGEFTALVLCYCLRLV